MKLKLNIKISLSIIFIMFIILFLNTSSYAGTQSWNALDYDVTINEDGSMDVVETWDVWVSETNTLFKSFEISIYDDYKIKNAKVSQVANGKENFLRQINEQQYHVDSGCYYGLQIDSLTYEIAWNVGFDNSSGSRIYKMYYTIENAVAIHNDCTELYWKFLSEKNSMSGENITGTIRLPKSVSNIEKLRVWGHGPLNAIINKDSADSVSFSVDSINSKEMLEVRIVTEENIYKKATNLTNRYKLETILAEEQAWADEANKEREKAKETLRNMRIAIVSIIIINILILIIFLIKRKKYKIIGEELKEKYSYQKSDLKYFRDIPDEDNATPARASYLYEFRKNSSNMVSNISKVFSATMLDLSLKGLIEFETSGEKEVKIYLKSDSQNKSTFLSEDERIIFDLLKNAKGTKDYITPKEFSKYASANYDTVYGKLNGIEKIVENDLETINKISTERKQIYKKWNSKFTIFLFLSLGLSIFCWVLPVLTVGFAILASVCRKNANNVSIFSEIGNEEEKQWKALKRYMEDYSMLDEKLVPDIILWEKYLVYATVFGISKKVIKQLKSVHPELFYNDSGSNLNRYAYWHIMTNSSFGDDYFQNFSKSLENVYNSAKSAYNIAHSSSSSGSGGGGGFSGGGGGRRWRW